MSASLVGSEMCIRDRAETPPPTNPTRKQHPPTRYKERRTRGGEKPLAGPRPPQYTAIARLCGLVGATAETRSAPA
eukprot:14208935-Alexandrium_andersonii.AAC.1